MRVAGEVSPTALPTQLNPRTRQTFIDVINGMLPTLLSQVLKSKETWSMWTKAWYFCTYLFTCKKIKLWFSNSLLAGRHNLRVELGRVSIQLRNEPMLQTQEFTQSGWFRERVSYLLAQTMPSHPPCHQKDKTLPREEGHLRLKQQTVGTE